MWPAPFGLAMKGALRSDRATHPTFGAEPLDPLGDCLRCRVEVIGRLGLAQPTFHHTPHHCLSTFGRQTRILVTVHLVSPWNTEASQPQLPRFGPDGQPPERPQLDQID